MRADPAMLGVSQHAREGNDAYATIDERCVQHLDKVWPLRGRMFVEPMAGYGDLVWQVEQCGGILEWCGDLHKYPHQDPRIETGRDLFVDTTQWSHLLGVTIITNPPYSSLRATVRWLLEQAPSAWVVILCRASQLHVKAMRTHLIGGRLWGVAPLPFRPLWYPSEGKSGENPRHEYAWFIWCPLWAINGPPRLLFEPPPPQLLETPPQPTPEALWWKGLPRG